MAKAANTNPMGYNAGREKVDQGAVRLARKRARQNIGPLGTNTKSPGVSLSRPNAKSSAKQPMGIGTPAAPSRARKLNRKPRTK